jgi:hypothetical protein
MRIGTKTEMILYHPSLHSVPPDYKKKTVEILFPYSPNAAYNEFKIGIPDCMPVFCFQLLNRELRTINFAKSNNNSKTGYNFRKLQPA